MMLNPENTLLVLIDVQEKLTAIMHDRDRLIVNLTKLLKGVKTLHIPVICMEQNPEKLGGTIVPLLELLDGTPPLAKLSFSCGDCEAFNTELRKSGRRQILIAGIETHVCVYQTAVTLIRDGYAVEVVADATSSRCLINHTVGLEKIRECGRHSTGSGQGHITTVETALFELLRSAEHAKFRDILNIVR